MAGPEGTTIRIDLRAALPVLALALVIFFIFFVELCGKTDLKPVTPSGTPFVAGPTVTPGPSFTPGPSPSPAPLEATATPENTAAGSDRDEVRQTDLHTIQTALEAYKQKHGKYPSTGDGIQTVCTFVDDDKGCALKEAITGGTVPQDPLGNGGENGYWLQSTDTTYIVYAQRESDLFPACDKPKPDHLKDFRAVFCLHNP
jgi:hypothetical protein